MKENKIRQLLSTQQPTTSTRIWSTWPFYTEVAGETGNFIMKTYLHQGAAKLPAADFRAGQGSLRISGGCGWKLRLPA